MKAKVDLLRLEKNTICPEGPVTNWGNAVCLPGQLVNSGPLSRASVAFFGKWKGLGD